MLITSSLMLMAFCAGQGGELWEKLTPADLHNLKSEASEKQKLARKLIKDASAYILQSCQVLHPTLMFGHQRCLTCCSCKVGLLMTYLLALGQAIRHCKQVKRKQSRLVASDRTCHRRRCRGLSAQQQYPLWQ